MHSMRSFLDELHGNYDGMTDPVSFECVITYVVYFFSVYCFVVGTTIILTQKIEAASLPRISVTSYGSTRALQLIEQTEVGGQVGEAARVVQQDRMRLLYAFVFTLVF